jgi:hypothetical protein
MAAWAGSASAQVGVFSAVLEPLPPNGIILNGFGRNTSRPDDLLNTFPSTLASAPFFDTWNINTAAVAPGLYNFSNLTVNATGGSSFAALTFNSYDVEGVRSTFLFNINPAGTQAVGSGNFTVLASCPVITCVWIDVVGLSPVGAPWGYSGTGVATVVPEPQQWALLGAGLLGLAAAVRRRKNA